MPGIEKPILLDFPDSFETERLIIRAPRAGDGQAVNDAVRESHENLKPWMPWATTIQAVEETEERVRQGAVRWILREDLWMLLFRKSDGLYVGGSGLHRIDWSVPAFEIGYWVRTSLEGKGYISEAVAGITNFGFGVLGGERIEIRCDTRNIRSANVAKRSGYTLESTLRHDSWATDGTLRDTYIFGMIRPEWETLQKANKGE
ncbi:MAG: GNAT family N-acetyltransferase [Anaerolineae bacterium]|nr:GNAT family N-acetyltransferase [Anaerolineae bacterium]